VKNDDRQPPAAITVHFDAMLTDDELVQGFEAATLPAFPHADHVRLTIVYLARHGREETRRRMLEGLAQFAAAKGQPEKFHVTMTHAWIDLIDAARAAHPDAPDTATLVGACPELLDRNALLRFYSAERLHSVDARERWVPPDRASRIGVDAQSTPEGDRSSETERI
jgi:hypothetical protein